MAQRIIALIARQPMLRASQIADKLDIEVDQAETLLRPLLVAGNVIEHEVVAPNNRPAMAYELSEQFKASDTMRAILAGSETPTPPAAAAPESTPAPRPERRASEKPPSKVDRAIAFLTENGSATAVQLRTVMGLQPNSAPSSWLTVALKSGRIVNEGGFYKLGQDKAPSDAPEPKKPEPPAVDRSDEPLQQLKQALKPPRFRSALWSDGQVEVQRDGMTVAELPRDVAEEVARFVGSLA